MGDFNQRRAVVNKPRARKKSGWTKFLLFLLCIIGIGAAAAYYTMYNLAPVSYNPKASAVSVTIPKGASAKQIGDILAQANLIRDPRFFYLYTRYKRYAGLYQSGEYSIKPNQDLQSIMDTLKKGSEKIRVTIPEGFTTKQIADLLVKQKLVDKDKFMNAVANTNFDFDFLQGLQPSESRLEGFLFPDTYEIERGSSEETIIQLMLTRFSKELTPEVKDAITKKGWSIKEFITLASLIEREARMPEDRPIISQVFQTRLQRKMRLQSCASVQFILGIAKPVLSIKDTQIDNPYNTYKYAGLPPGPIANPGRASIIAAAFPAETDYVFFVAKPDGYHAFAKTLDEHNRNIKKYE